MRRPFSVNVILDICSFFEICCCCCCPPSLRIVFPLPHPVSNSSPITPAHSCSHLLANIMAAARQLPETFRKLVITKLSTNYREAVELKTVPMLQPGPNELLIKNR